MSEVNPFEAPAERSYGSDYLPEGEYGGIGRGAYFGLTFLIGIINNVLQAVFVNSDLAAAALLVALVGLGATLYIVYLRLQNLGYSGWWVLGIIVPILNILVGLRCLAAPEGYAHHKTLDSTGKIIVGLFFGVIILAVLAVVVAISMS